MCRKRTWCKSIAHIMGEKRSIFLCMHGYFLLLSSEYASSPRIIIPKFCNPSWGLHAIFSTFLCLHHFYDPTVQVYIWFYRDYATKDMPHSSQMCHGGKDKTNFFFLLLHWVVLPPKGSRVLGWILGYCLCGVHMLSCSHAVPLGSLVSSHFPKLWWF